MSWAFITAIKQNPNQSYVQLLNSIRDVLASKYTQKPQLSCSHPLGKFDVATQAFHSSLLTKDRHEPSLCHVMVGVVLGVFFGYGLCGYE